nr:MAG: hypothetical protein [brine shrimp yue-like virus 3]
MGKNTVKKTDNDKPPADPRIRKDSTDEEEKEQRERDIREGGRNSGETGENAPRGRGGLQEEDSGDELTAAEAIVFQRYRDLGLVSSGMNARLPNSLDYSLPGLINKWKAQNSVGDNILIGMLARLETYKEIKDANYIPNSSERLPYIPVYELQKNEDKAPDNITESQCKGRIFIDNLPGLYKLGASEIARYEDIFIAFQKSSFWIICLTACFQTKPLTENSISNFFKYLETTCPDTKTLSQIFKYAKGVLPIFMRDKEIRKRLRQVPFMVYHTSSCSSPHILVRVISELGSMANVYFSDEEMNVIIDAKNHYWDLNKARQIPVKCIAIAHTYLNVMGKQIPNWYQGNKSVQDIPFGVIAQWTQFFTKFKELTQQNVDLKNIKTIEELIELAMKTSPGVVDDDE